MDNKSMFYKTRYQVAERHAEAGEYSRCREILWDIRLQPDLSLFRRAHVNLLLACTTDIRQHPDKSKFAQECIDLISQIRRNEELSISEEERFDRMERHAQQTLRDIQTEAERAKILATAKETGMNVTEATRQMLNKVGIDEKAPGSPADAGMASVGSGTGLPSDSAIGGMYTNKQTTPSPARKSVSEGRFSGPLTREPSSPARPASEH